MEEKTKGELVQQKIKQMIQTRKRILSKNNAQPLKRMKSNVEAEQTSIVEEQQIQDKPKSSMIIRMRPRTSKKTKNQQTNSRTTDSSNKNDIDVKTLVDGAFLKGFQLGKYLNKRNLDPEQSKQKLLQIDLFYTLLISKLSKVQEEKYQHVTQKQIIAKLQKILIIQRQQTNCRLIQDKISCLIEEKLRSLSRC